MGNLVVLVSLAGYQVAVHAGALFADFLLVAQWNLLVIDGRVFVALVWHDQAYVLSLKGLVYHRLAVQNLGLVEGLLPLGRSAVSHVGTMDV